MANTYKQIYMHIVFAVARREALIADEWMPRLHAYIAGAFRQRNHFVHAVGGTADHVHILLGMHPAESVATLVKEIKGQSSHWINQTFLGGAFAWQAGYGAFSYSRTHVPAVKAYIENQREHHRRVTFEDELADIFRKFGVDYDPRYMMRGHVPADGNGNDTTAANGRVPDGTPATVQPSAPAVETAGYHCQTPDGVPSGGNGVLSGGNGVPSGGNGVPSGGNHNETNNN